MGDIDFSDTESNHDKDMEHEEDEQHTQKVNGKIETLEMRVKELESALQKEQKDHTKTKELLIKSKNNLDVESSRLSPAINQQLLHLCYLNSIEHDLVPDEPFDDARIEFCLKAMGKKLKKSSRKGLMPTSGGLESESLEEALADEKVSVEEKLKIAANIATSLEVLKNKYKRATTNLANEKEAKYKAEDELKRTTKKM